MARRWRAATRIRRGAFFQPPFSAPPLPPPALRPSGTRKTALRPPRGHFLAVPGLTTVAATGPQPIFEPAAPIARWMVGEPLTRWQTGDPISRWKVETP